MSETVNQTSVGPPLFLRPLFPILLLYKYHIPTAAIITTIITAEFFSSTGVIAPIPCSDLMPEPEELFVVTLVVLVAVLFFVRLDDVALVLL